VLGEHGYATRESILRDAETDERAPLPASGRRSGLGRGLDSLISASADDAAPAQLQVATALHVPPAPPRLDLVGTEEKADGIAVRAVDSLRPSRHLADLSRRRTPPGGDCGRGRAFW
jgi:hypothetical protein